MPDSKAVPLIFPCLIKASYTNYTRNYVYDRAEHDADPSPAPATGNNYTTDITVGRHAATGGTENPADTPEKAGSLFTPADSRHNPARQDTVSWTARGELKQVTPVVRNGAAGDRESYRYDAGSQRILKPPCRKPATAHR